ncbi:competence/damage-inducible protein A [Paenibacillus sp. CGMCC 1.16610]|uniref:Putative competence-damage inducible protein n=1 Tax=Paenibacillus anseongense TaxID=2682845 RepID=A0ABW9UBG3_9BACL|nr:MULTISPECIES: competence/damage-inducible protein A [Paenibacillus]MBA2937763.1 competence/damage-inducible protein A [Paenibacillus sp. CGMCC 1.16610]MVQ36821.1 competence/damage-inducible protein A [Paenibacillus anseongense]
MKAEIVAVGTELLLGQIVNTNAQFLSRECAAIGVDIYFQTVVGDNEQRLLESLTLAASRADVVICTGGLGPTQDDLTKDVLAAYVGRQLIIHEPSMNAITQMFQSRGIHMVESNRRQALMLEGSDPLHNETGLAVGVAFTFEGTHFILLPGPPKEMKPMFTNYAIPWLRAVMHDEVPLYSKMLKFAGIGESNLEHQLIDLIQAQSDPTIAPYAKEGEVTIRLTTRAQTAEEGERKLFATEQEIRSRLGQHIYADQDVPIETTVLKMLDERKLSLAVAESCTGGLLSDLITSIPGSSNSFLGGIICYSNALKHKLLGVPMEVLEGEGAPGAVSSETAVILAESLLTTTGSDFGISVTGVAGPGSSEGKPVGLVYIGFAQKNAETQVITLQLSGNRESIKHRSAKSALYHLWKQLKES